MSNRRGKGEGSIYKRKDGLWVGQYKVHALQGVKTKYLYSKTRREVAAKLAKAIANRDSGLIFDSGSLTLGDYLDKWLQAIRQTISAGSWKQYEMIVRLHLGPTLGNIKISNLNALQVQSLYHQKLDSGLSPRRVLYVHVTLHKALKQAVKWSLIPRNVTEAIDPPRPHKKEIKPLTEEQVKQLLKTAKGNKLEALYILAVTTGMRQGELLGLQWRDFDFQARTLRVNRTIFNGAVSPPKTAKGHRSITLTRSAMAVLKEHKEKQSKDSKWVFSTKIGTPLDCNNFTKQAWKPLLRKAGLPDTRFHTLRHTAATLLLTKGVHPKIVQELLGHSTISITLDTYSHVLPNMQEKAVRAMEDILE